MGGEAQGGEEVKGPLRRQKPLKGGRLPAHSALIPEIEQALENEMSRYHESRSFVIATALAYVFRIDQQETV